MSATSGHRPALIAFRPPLVLRIYAAAFMAIWCGGVLTVAAALTVKWSPKAVVPLIMAVAGATFAVRMIRMCVALGRDDLVLRNLMTTRRLERGEIEEFRIGAGGRHTCHSLRPG